MVSRRDFLKLGSAALAGSFFIGDKLNSEQIPSRTRKYKGKNFAGWEIALGDAIYARAGEAPVSLADIETVNEDDYSQLRANIQSRIIMAHNITFKRIINSRARKFVHTCTYDFRLPYLPIPDTSASLNAQTLEGGLFVWDGAETRLDYGIAFQWSLNPWNEFGFIRTWTDTNGGEWLNVGELTPDMEWHQVTMIVDFRRETTALLIDNKHYLSYLTRIQKPPDWGNEVAARLQAEIVSIDPEPSGMRAMHKAQFKNWVWLWESSNRSNSESDSES